MSRLTKTYEDGTYGVADILPCGENSHEFKRLLIDKLGKYETLFNIENIQIAFAVANNAIYFNDKSDYLSALYEVCRLLNPDFQIGKQYVEE